MKLGNIKNSNTGIILVMVLSTILVVVVLANIIVALISSQIRLASHQIERLQAYYAARAGTNLAFEALRTGAWNNNLTYCINCTTGVPVAQRFSDPAIPYIVMIVLTPAGNAGCPSPPAPANGACISSSVDYRTP